ncbi:MAG TPA: hypothetical protein VGU02_12595 [Gaiellaceae bacterium]|nr:hypothetical protein [Gaiellaceae bacterium]
MRRLLILTLIGSAAGMSVAEVSVAGDRIRAAPNHADQLAAQQALPRVGELSGKGWTAGKLKSNMVNGPTSAATCGRERSSSTFVQTADASRDYDSSRSSVSADVVVYKTATMVALDWKHTLGMRDPLSCMRTLIAPATSKTMKLVSLRQESLPPGSRQTRVYRAVLSVATAGRTIYAVLYYGIATHRRGELIVGESTFGDKNANLLADSLRLLKLLSSRAPA